MRELTGLTGEHWFQRARLRARGRAGYLAVRSGDRCRVPAPDGNVESGVRPLRETPNASLILALLAPTPNTALCSPSRAASRRSPPSSTSRSNPPS